MQTIRDLIHAASYGLRLAINEFHTRRHLRRGGNPDLIPF